MGIVIYHTAIMRQDEATTVDIGKTCLTAPPIEPLVSMNLSP
jgi:hypothetical protein